MKLFLLKQNMSGAVREYRPETPKITKKLHAGKAIKSYFKGKMHQFKTELILIAQLTPQYAPRAQTPVCPHCAIRECRPETPKITKKRHAGKAIKSYLKTELILIAQLTPQYAPTGVNLGRDYPRLV